MGDSSSASSTTSSRRRLGILRRRGREVQNDGPTRLCCCGLSSPLCTSWTELNPGRRFYGCRNFQQGGCGFFQWHDEEMGERASNVINDLLGHVDRLYDENVRLKSKHGTGVCNVAVDASANVSRLCEEMKKTERRLRVAFVALVLTWVFFVVLIVLK